MKKKRSKLATSLEIVVALAIAGTIALGATGAPGSATVSPRTRETAAQLFVRGATPAQVAAELHIEPEQAREILRSTIANLQQQLETR